ncbi:BRCA1-associated ATM activator 1 isoform X2 [Corythoichthys intestinalis]|uniref:BRCA1-associated ATM activator 1 isoform X2 n=1 Tax=Corythoichthys intestinalis TaxID=161448 RepID=UPI0025A56811|nr:BRCA1-associated ATM activator 1 isoform X2 [Corythoichthys intestinalis]
MDNDTATLLPGVCALLADSGKPLPDDTSLEKLLDRLTEVSEAGVSLPENFPCLLDLISTMASNTTSDPSILSFALKLCGLMAATEDGFMALQECFALEAFFSVQRWKDTELWEDPCIRIGWIHGLSKMLLHPRALSFFVQSGFTNPLLQLQLDPSMFVSSAANQLLAHILLSIQPEEVHANTKISAEYSAVVLQLSNHIKEALVPKEGVLVTGSLQVLKLLALILDQAHHSLRDQLLNAVAASLEELIEAGYSQLTLPLMDVIMARYSPDSHDVTSHLLSSMFKNNNLIDLVHAADAFLHRGHLRDSVHTSQAVRILLLPLHCVTEHPLLETAADNHHAMMAAQLKNKSKFISMICVCLRNTPQLAFMPPDVLPCSPTMIVLSVVTLLRMFSGDTSSTSSSSLFNGYKNEKVQCIISSRKVQKCALEMLVSLSASPGVTNTVKEISEVLIHNINNPISDPTVLQKSYKALIQWLSVCKDHSSIPQLLREELLMSVKKRACDPRWEVRDSTIEFLGQLPCITSKKSADEALLSECCTAPLLWEALQDPESYVRASAILALAHIGTSSWQQGTEMPLEQADTVSRLLDILREDTEGFARRAVVRYFIALFATYSSTPLSTPSILIDSIGVVLSRGSLDLDWEVKVHTLELVELLLDSTFLEHRRHCAYGHMHGGDATLDSPLSSLVNQGVFSVLLRSLLDCDRPVALKACELLITIRDKICSAGVLTGVCCELPEQEWGKEIRTLLKNEGNEGNEGGLVGVYEVLASLGLDERRVLLSQSSDHVHNSFQSLLQDILSTGATLGCKEQQDDQEVIVDCY